MLELIVSSGHWEYILFFSVFGIDAAFTIFYRLVKKENIFRAHRSHLYQYLANEAKWPQLRISIIYAVVQAGINLLVIWAAKNELLNPLNAIVFLIFLSVIYGVIRLAVYRKFVQVT